MGIHEEIERLLRRLERETRPGPQLRLDALGEEERERAYHLLRRHRGETVPEGPVEWPNPAARRYYEAHPEREPPEEWKVGRAPPQLSEEEEAELIDYLYRVGMPSVRRMVDESLERQDEEEDDDWGPGAGGGTTRSEQAD